MRYLMFSSFLNSSSIRGLQLGLPGLKFALNGTTINLLAKAPVLSLNLGISLAEINSLPL